MTKVIARHKIVRREDGKRVEVLPGTEFECSGDELERLRAAGAVKDVPRREKADQSDAEAEEKARQEAEEKARQEAEEKARQEAEAGKVTVVQDDDNGFVVEMAGIRFSPAKNTVREDGTLTKKGQEAFEAAKAEAEQQGGSDDDNLV